jgi:predicted outer membrane lipoprotein
VDPFLKVLGTALGALGVITAAWLTFKASRAKQRADTSMQMIDQHQEDIVELRKESTEQRQRIGSLERTQRIQGDYIGELRRHISDGRPPPPPPYPEGLIT